MFPLIRSLSENQSLKYLDISGNNLGELGALIVASAFRLNEGVQVLKLDNNNIGYNGWISICSIFNNNKTLRYLEFPWKDFDKFSKVIFKNF